jgi:hypothetical protein
VDITTPSKYVLTKSLALPSTCMGCHRSANGIVDFIDLGFSLDWYGAVGLCTDCVKEMLTLIDYVPVAKVAELQEENLKLREALVIERSYVDRLTSGLHAISALRSDLSRDLLTDEKSDSTDEQSVGTTEPGNPQSEEDNSGTDEPATVGGPEDIPESSVDIEPQPKFV